MDVVLEMAHKCEDLGNNNQNAVSGVPSRERLIEKILFSVGDILTICAIDVDMDYCVKGTTLYHSHPSLRIYLLSSANTGFLFIR